MKRKMDAARGFRTIQYQLYILFVTVSSYAFAGNELKIMRTSSNSIDIQLTNSDSVTGIQFCVRTSHDIVLKSVQPGTRVKESSWMVASYNVNDSTVNVVVLNTRQQSFPQGSGTLASIMFSMVNPDEKKCIKLKNVMVIDAQGDSLGVTISNLKLIDNDFSGSNTGESQSFVLEQNYPNPFNPATILNYRLNTAAYVRLSVYDITGREVSRLVDQYQHAGDYQVPWDSHLGNGKILASGIYIARLNVDKSSVSRKMLLTK
jgi:hypothetical protein